MKLRSEVLFLFYQDILALETIVKNAAPASEAGPITVTWRKVVTCILITLVGFNLRSVILGVPPVLPLIQHDLGLSYTATGFLTALPVLALAVGAWPSGLLAERIGARLIVSIGLALLGAGALLRAFRLTTFSLFLFTLLLSVGIALTQTAVPVLIRRWFPKQIGLVSALFSDGLIIGEAVAAGITVLIMVRFLGGDAWASTFIFWGIPVVVLFAFWLWLAPPAPAKVTRPHSSPQNAKTPTPNTSLPIQRKRVSALHLGILVGGGSLVYFGMNAWIASYNQAMHQSYLTPVALLTLNAAQLPVSLAVTFVAQQLLGRRWPFIVAGIVSSFTIVGWVFTPAVLEPLWAALLGGSGALVFTLGTALPPLLASPQEVGRLTGITLSLTYGVAFVGPFIGGALWDLFNLPALVFVPVLIASIMLVVLGALLPSRASFGILGETMHTGKSEHKPGVIKSTPPTA
jgi:MFS transporter, CP family, cyanate transporter